MELAKFGKSFEAEQYSDVYFDECFAKNGISEGEEYYGAGIGGNLFKKAEERLEKVSEINKAFNVRIAKERGTTTSESATGTTYSATSGSVPTLLPIWVSPDIISLSMKDTPVLSLLPRIAVKGKFYDWNTVTLPSTYAAFKPEDASLNEFDETYTRNSVPMKYLYSVGRVTGPMQIHSQGYLNAEQNEVQQKTMALMHKLEEEIINGATSDDANGFNGIAAGISTNSVTQSAVISVSAVRTSILHAKQGAETYSETVSGGNPNLIITDLQTYDDLKALITPYLRYNDSVNVSFGIKSFDFEGIPVIASKFMTTTSTSKQLLVIDTAFVKLAVALDITFERLAKTNDSNKFYIKWYGALVNLKETACAKIITIT